jgi:plastocyanin
MQVRVAGAVVVAGGMAAAVVLAGCGSGSSGGTASGGTTSGGTTAGGTASGGTTSGGTTPGSSSSASAAGGASSSSAPAAGGASSGGSGAVTAVTVDASEYKLALPSNHLAPGTYTFTMDNVGHATHSIEISGPGVQDAKSRTAGPGGTATLTVTLQPGSYEMWCPVGNHKQAGMDTTITVG